MIRFEIEEIQRQVDLAQKDRILEGPQGETRLSALAGPVTLLASTPQECTDCAAMLAIFDAVQQDNPSLRIILLAEQADQLGEHIRYRMPPSTHGARALCPC